VLLHVELKRLDAWFAGGFDWCVSTFVCEGGLAPAARDLRAFIYLHTGVYDVTVCSV
jgi:hypothetical protein